MHKREKEREREKEKRCNEGGINSNREIEIENIRAN
jgi:hypothetical protein